jgi:hypothetical protein
MVVALLATAWGGDGAVNEKGMIWQVRYHETHKSKKTDDMAVRLKIEWIDEKAGTIKGTLFRYDELDVTNPKKKKYKLREEPPGKIEGFEGKIVSKGGGKNRKREEFILSKKYEYQDKAKMKKKREVTIQGFHHAGRLRDDRTDDSICIRIYDRPDTMLARLVDMCDEQPPDEDNLGEENDSPDPPEYDGDGG